ncbi:MAG: enoyl-CoA hydratase/isomerase family protein [Chloroflexi bacterium]|nr:enoyl-CoA hydratase/isomerase family protein [Chloroflexota bacterium]
MGEESILYEKDLEKNRATITINRPEKLNALTIDMWNDITQKVIQAERDDDVKVIVLRGNGRCFCSGHDVADLGPHHGWSPDPKARRPSQRRRLIVDDNVFWGRRGTCQTVLYCDKATIAQVQGYCYGAGLQIAQACDLIVAAEDSLFTHPGYRYIGPLGEIVSLIHTMGIRKVKEMMLTGKALNALEALEYGLVNKVVPLDGLEAAVDELANIIALQPRDAIVLGKANFELALDIMGVGAGYTAGYITHTLQTNIRYEDDEFNLFKERQRKGMKGAFQEREKRFSGSPLAH